jgi:acyl dehydratase
MRIFENLEAFLAAAGTELGTSDWMTIEQDRIDQFAEATGDHQWIHVDPVRAAEGPFGGTIAHGYLTLALIPPLAESIYRVDGLSMVVNYGAEKLRFPQAVPAGSEVRAVASLVSTETAGSGTRARVRFEIEVRDSAKPACLVEAVYLLVP